MKLRQLQINDNEFSLAFEAEGKELKTLFELFDELKAVAMMVDEAKKYRVNMTDDRLDERVRRVLPLATSLPLPEKVSVSGLRQPSEIVEPGLTNADHFVLEVIDNIEFRGDWVENNMAPEPRLERTIACAFYRNGEIKDAFESWEAMIEDRIPPGLENPSLAAVALLPKKQYLLSEGELERQQKKNNALNEAKEELKRAAYSFYHGTLNQETEEAQTEGVSNNGDSKERA